MTKDKKQIIVVGALFAVILAVGAFQFLGPKPKPVTEDEPKGKKEEALVAKTEVDPTEMVINQLFSQPLAARDPFTPQAVILDDPVEQPPVEQPPVERPNPLPGEVKPFDPGVNQGGQIQPNLELTQNRDPWSLRGIIVGRRTMAMLEDDKGNQFLVREGDQFNNGNTRVLSISKTQVELSHNGKITTLALLGGN